MEDLHEEEADFGCDGFGAGTALLSEGPVSERPASERIVAAARELFCRDGIHATGIDRILSAAGASKMALYAKFGSKEALVHEVLLREGAAWRTAFFAEMNRGAPAALGRLRHLVPALAAWFDSGRFYGCSFMNASAEHAKGEPNLRALAVEHHRIIREHLVAIAIEAGIAEPDRVVRRMMLVMDGTIASLMVAGDRGVLAVAQENIDAILQSSIDHISQK